MASATRQHFSFLDLPGEIRNSIYGYSFLPKTIGKPQEMNSEEPQQMNFEKRRNYRGTSNVLRLCQQVYNECHHILHDQQKTLQLSASYPRPPAPSRQSRPPLFRQHRTSYKPSVNIFTSTEFRRFTNVVLEIDYLFLSRALKSHPLLHDEKASRDLEHALWVLGSSYSLEKLCLRLFSTGRGSGALTDPPRPPYFLDIILLLAPIVRVGGPSTKIRAENPSGDIDPVVNWFNRSRRQWEAEQKRMGSYNGGIQIFPTGFKFSSAVERRRFMRREGSMLVDIRKLFENAEYLDQSIPTRNFKCCECFMVFESAKTLSAHQHASLHYAKTILHDSKSFRKACSEFCRHYSKEHRFTRRPDSAFRCGTCLTKYSYEEGLKVHLAFWKYSDYDPVSAYEDIGRLFDPLYKPYSKCFECRTCWAFYECKNQLFKHVFSKKHFYPPAPADQNDKKKGK
jgi:hypothetical protein